MNKNLRFLTACHNVNPIGEVTYAGLMKIAKCPQCFNIAIVRWTNVD